MENCYVYRKSGQVGDMTGNLLLVAGVGIAGWLLFKKFGDLFDTAGSQANKDIAANTGATVVNDQQSPAGQASKPTLSDSTLSTLANTLYYQMINNEFSGNIVQSVAQIGTYTDWLRLVQLYGTKKLNSSLSTFSPCNLFGLGCDAMDLGSSLKLVLPAQYLSNLNSYFSQAHIPVIL